MQAVQSERAARAAAVPGGLIGGELVKTFRDQVEELARRIGATNQKLLDATQKVTGELAKPVSVGRFPEVDYDNAPDVVAITSADTVATPSSGGARNFDSLAGLLPYSKMEVRIGNTNWIVRTRPSLTACALQQGAGRTKLWWSFEGIPVPGPSGEGPTQEQSMQFVAMVDRLVEPALGFLRDEYHCILESNSAARTTDFELQDYIRVNMADNETRPVAELIDAIYFRHAHVRDILDAPGDDRLSGAKPGLFELDRFAAEVTHKKLGIGHGVRVESASAGAKAVVCHRANFGGRYAALVTGFAQRPGSRDGFGPQSGPLFLSRGESSLRLLSPSRVLSARLADKEARLVDQRDRKMVAA